MEEELQKAELEDLQEISNLYKEAIEHMTLNGIMQWDEIYPDKVVLTEDVMQSDMYVLRDKGRIVACAVLNEDWDEEYETGHWCYTDGKIVALHRLCVLPFAQGAGVGKKTMRLVEQLARDKGYQILRLDSFSMNPGARHMYEVLGYTYAGEVQFRKGLFYLMEKRL